MPNGGSDCCGTCWFNAKNKGLAGYEHAHDSEPAFCTIRNLPIKDPFYTYCGNHPYRRPEGDPIPIGPVYVEGNSGDREIWKASPDTEEIRQHLLMLLDQMDDRPVSDYPLGSATDESVIRQLGEFREQRALERLRQLATIQPDAAETGAGDNRRLRLFLIAKMVLPKIEREST